MKRPPHIKAPLIALVLLAGSALIVGCQSDDPMPLADAEPTVANAGAAAFPTRLVDGQVMPDFERMDAVDLAERMQAAIVWSEQALAQIVGNPQPPSYDNTLAALATLEQALSEPAAIFQGLRLVQNPNDWAELHRDLSARLAEHASKLRSDPDLFRRLQALAASDRSDWRAIENRLLDESLRRMARAGAGLASNQRQKLSRIESDLAELGAEFQSNLDHETQRFELHLNTPEALAGLPPVLIEQAARDARDRGHQTGWSFTLNAHSLFPFLRHAEQRDSRRRLYQAWQRRAGGLRYGQTRDNHELIRRILRLRAERAEILGFQNHLALVLADSSAGDLDQIKRMMAGLEQAARPHAERELASIRRALHDDGIHDEPQAWDWWYYREQLRSEAGNAHGWPMNPSLEQAVSGMFRLAGEFWGLRFEAREDLPRWHPDVRTYRVEDTNARLLGWLYLDLHHRTGKAGGAWISQYPATDAESGRPLPLVAAVANLPAAGPHGVTPDQAETLLHEFGHALHVLLSEIEPVALAGTRVPSDFVEFPALLFERWARQPAWLEAFVLTADECDHDSIAPARQPAGMNGLITLEQIAASRIDLAFHQIHSGQNVRLEAMEKRIAQAMALPPLLSPRHPHDAGYAAVFVGNRAGQDYRGLWSAVLAADAFAVFMDDGIFDLASAERLRREILAQGNARDPMLSFEAFRGRPPQIDALIRERGLD
jgi:peptidyl-dipeptidase Dcp